MSAGVRGRSDVAAGSGFTLVAVPAAPELTDGLPDVAVGARVPVQLAARRWVSAARQLLGRGRIVAFDYGADTAVLAERASPGGDPAERASPCGDPAVEGDSGAGGDLASGNDPGPGGYPAADDDLAAGLGWLRTHRRHNGSAGWLTGPGACDITTDVALDQVQADFPAEVCTQAGFLRRHGIDELVAEGQEVWSRRAHMGDLDAMRARSRAVEAEALLDPDGMGGFKVLTWSVPETAGSPAVTA